MFATTVLLLASQSQSRIMLLEQAGIPFAVIKQDADESACDWGLPLDKLVLSISLHKMNHVILPEGNDGTVIFVLTADTLSQDANGTIQGKPKDQADAIEKIKQARDGTRLCTAFCLDKRVMKNGEWKLEDRIHEVVHAEYLFHIPDNWIEHYLKITTALTCSNAIAVEEYGSQFLKQVRGSYSAIVGLPMYELREALERIGFF